jgi:hypothetical protein
LLPDEGYAASFKELLDDTPWDKYGNSSNPKCAQCMAHCGYEATAVEDALQHPLKALITSIRGPKTTGPMVAEPAPKWVTEQRKPRKTPAGSSKGGTISHTDLTLQAIDKALRGH